MQHFARQRSVAEAFHNCRAAVAQRALGCCHECAGLHSISSCAGTELESMQLESLVSPTRHVHPTSLAHMDLAAAQRGVGEHGDGVQRVRGVVKLHNAAAAGPPLRVLRAGTGSMGNWVSGDENRIQYSAGQTTPQGVAGQAGMQRRQSSCTGKASCDTSPGGAGRALKQAMRMGADLGDTFTSRGSPSARQRVQHVRLP